MTNGEVLTLLQSRETAPEGADAWRQLGDEDRRRVRAAVTDPEVASWLDAELHPATELVVRALADQDLQPLQQACRLVEETWDSARPFRPAVLDQLRDSLAMAREGDDPNLLLAHAVLEWGE